MAETININGETIEVTQDSILDRIEQFQEYDSFTYEENQEYQELVNVAIQNDYIPSADKDSYLSFTPVGGKEGEIAHAFPDPMSYLQTHHDDPDVYDVIVNNYTREDINFMMESGGLDADTIELLDGTVNSKYSSLDIEFAQKSMGDFHYSGDSLINVIVESVDCDSKIRTAYTSLTTLKAENETSNDFLGMGSMDDAIVAALPEHLQGKYVYIGSSINTLNTDIENISDSLKLVADASENYNDEVEKVAKVIASVDTEFASKLKSSIEDYTTSMIKKLETGAISFDAGQFYETINRYLDSDLSNLDLSDKERKFLGEIFKLGENESKYYHSNNFEKFIMNAEAVPFWVAEGFLDKAEGIVDGGITIVGGCVSNYLYSGSLFAGSLADLTGNEELAAVSSYLKESGDNTTHLTRTVIGYDISHETMSNLALTYGVNEYVYETSDVANPSKAVGGVLFDVALSATGLPEPVLKGIKFASAVNGEKYAQNTDLTDSQYWSAANANMLKVAVFDYVSPELLNSIKPTSIRGEVGKTALTLGLDVGKFLTNEAISYNVGNAKAYNEDGTVPTVNGFLGSISKGDKLIPLGVGLLDKTVSSVASYGKYEEEGIVKELVGMGYTKEEAHSIYENNYQTGIADRGIVKLAKGITGLETAYNAYSNPGNSLFKNVKSVTGLDIPGLDSKSLKTSAVKGGIIIYDEYNSATAETIEEVPVSVEEEVKPSTNINDYIFRGGVLSRRTK